MGRLTWIGGIFACWLSLWSAVPAASAGWTPPIKISATDVNTEEPQIAVDGAGNITAVWVSGSSSRDIRTAGRLAGGAWGPPSTLISSTENCEDPRLAVNPAGAAVVVADCDPGTAVMRGAYRPAGGSWSVSSEEVPESDSGKEPRVGLDKVGNATVVWEKEGGTIQSSYRPTAGPWGATAKQVSPAGNETLLPQIAIDPVGGTETAIWLHKVSGTEFTVETKDRLGGGEWSGPVKVLSAASKAGYEPQVRWNANGQRIAAWALDATPDILQSRSGGVGSWSEAASIKTASDGVNDVEAPQVAIDGQGRLVAAWRIPAFFSQTAFTSSLGGSWSSPAPFLTVPTGGFAGTEPQLAIDPSGDATVVEYASGEIYAASRPAGGAFAAATPLGFGTIEPQVAMDTTGDAFAAWANLGVGIEVALIDASPPVLSAIVVPVNAKTGSAVAMSASATDAWSPPATIKWDFGDGATATGGAVSHSFATAGTKTVTVTATDAVGNTSASQTRQITVTQTPTETNKPRVTLRVIVPKQSWKAISKAKAVKLKCSLDVAGTCKATATVTHAVAGRLGLPLGKGKRPVQVGNGTVRIATGGHLTDLKVQLTNKARAAIARATRNVPLTLTVTGSASGHKSATLARTLTIHRP